MVVFRGICCAKYTATGLFGLFLENRAILLINKRLLLAQFGLDPYNSAPNCCGVEQSGSSSGS